MDKKLLKSDNLKIDIGCGAVKKKGFLGVDKFVYPGVDVLADLDKKLPFKDNSVIEVYTAHTLEHIENLEFTMSEIYRICKPKARIIIRVPHFSGRSGFYEFHKRFFRYDSFTDLEPDYDGMLVSENKMEFKIIRRKIRFLKKWYLFWNYFVEPLINMHYKLCVLYEETFLRNLFPAYEVCFELRVIK